MVAAWKAVLAQIEALPEPEQEELVQLLKAEVHRLQTRRQAGVAADVAATIDQVATRHAEALSKLA